MKFDAKFWVGLIGACLVGAINFIGGFFNWPATIISAMVAVIAWIIAWLNGRNNTVA